MAGTTFEFELKFLSANHRNENNVYKNHWNQKLEWNQRHGPSQRSECHVAFTRLKLTFL